MSARGEHKPRVAHTRLQVAWAAQAEVFSVVRDHLDRREREEFYALAATQLARATALDADWDVWEERS